MPPDSAVRPSRVASPFLSKVWVIIRREYGTRIRSRGYILATFLGPLALVVLVALPVLMTQYLGRGAERRVAVRDETRVLFDDLDPPDEVRFERTVLPLDSLRAQVQTGRLDGALVLPEALLHGEGEAVYYSLGGGGLAFRFNLERALGHAVRDRRLDAAGAPPEVREILDDGVRLEMVKVGQNGEDTADDTGLIAGIGYGMGFVIYLCVFIYGSLVMRGVIEEKTSRIMEVIVSSARPFELMLGKVVGIGAVGLTQLLVWILLSAGLLVAAGLLLAGAVDPADYDLPATASSDALLAAADIRLPHVPLGLVVYFVVFFLGGYLLYASLFAAVGSVVDQEADAQQFVLPISMPIILSFIFTGFIITSPDGTLAVALSLIPLLSPILMIVRLAITNVPFWQVALSLFLLGAAGLGTIWLSARIYRIGILMYGKKPSFRDVYRWMRTA